MDPHCPYIPCLIGTLSLCIVVIVVIVVMRSRGGGDEPVLLLKADTNTGKCIDNTKKTKLLNIKL